MEKLLHTFLQAFENKGYTVLGIENTIHILANEQGLIYVDDIPISFGALEDNIFVFMDFNFCPIKGINLNYVSNISITKDSIIVEGKDNKEIIFTF